MAIREQAGKWLRGLWCLGLGLLVSCGGDGERGGRPLVVATTTMAADLVRQVAGERVEVHGLMGPGVDPHSYVPKLADSGWLQRADAVVYNGLHLEGRMGAALEAMAGRGRPVLALAEALPDERLLAADEGEGKTHDPHVWGDPRLWSEAVEPLVELLVRLDPAGEDSFRANGARLRQDLVELAARCQGWIDAIPPQQRVLVTSHDAFHYFARAFGLEVRALQGISSATEAGLRDRAELVAFLRERKIPAVFAESTVSSKGIGSVAEEAGARLARRDLFSDALGEPGDLLEVEGRVYDRGTYQGMVVHNVRAVVEELGSKQDASGR